MSDFDRKQHRFPESKFFEDLKVGDGFYIPSRTVTDANFAAFQTCPVTTIRSITTSNTAVSAAIRGRKRMGFRCCASPLPAPAPLRM